MAHSVLSEYAAVEDVAIFAENYKSVAASQANTVLRMQTVHI